MADSIRNETGQIDLREWAGYGTGRYNPRAKFGQRPVTVTGEKAMDGKTYGMLDPFCPEAV